MTDDAPMTPAQIVDHARLTAQKHGKVMLPEMIDALDDLVSQRCDSARANVRAFGPEHWDWNIWGRRTHVLEATLAFLQRIGDDPELRDMVAKRLRKSGG